jgi:hypothetical protein
MFPVSDRGLRIIAKSASKRLCGSLHKRFNRTIKADVLRGLDGHPDVDSDCGALELRLAHYIEHVYEDVARRIAHYATLGTLSRDEIGSYVEHRCTIAGSGSVPFDSGAIDALFEIGRGNLRATDQLARKSLEVAHQHDRDACSPADVAHARKMLWP